VCTGLPGRTSLPGLYAAGEAACTDMEVLSAKFGTSCGTTWA